MPYFQFRSELSIAEGIVFKGDKIVIPSSLRKEMKERIHQGHLGIEKFKARARQVMYWPNINADISDMVSNGTICIENQCHHQREPLISHDVPTQPWYKVGMDLFSFKGQSYLVIVDYFSNFPELCHLSDTHSTSVIAKVKATFSRYGIPKYVVSDNGPQFSSFEFAQFAKGWDFIHDPSSPKYPKSNGMAENAVKIVKGLLKKADKHKEDPYLALIAHRSTPSSSDNKSPYEKLFGHAMRTTLIRIRKDNSWPTKAKVIAKAQSPRSYFVKTEEGNTMRRNRSDLLKSNEQFTQAPPDIDKPVSESTDSLSASHPIPNLDTSQSYRSCLRSSVNPPSRFGFDVERRKQK